MPATMRHASPKQLAFIKSLATSRNLSTLPVTVADDVRDVLANVGGYLDTTGASKLIETLLAAPKVAPVAVAPVACPVTVPGMYRKGDTIYRVVKGKRNPSKLYAKRLVHIGGIRLTERDDVVSFDYEYDASAIYRLTADDRMTVAAVGALGIKYGACLVCGRLLKDAVSVSRGIGPVCISRI